jgi:hypothetical protein
LAQFLKNPFWVNNLYIFLDLRAAIPARWYFMKSDGFLLPIENAPWQNARLYLVVHQEHT